jgi:hypothetical protein
VALVTILLRKSWKRAWKRPQELLPSEGWAVISANWSDHRLPIWTRPYPQSFWGYIIRNPRPDSFVSDSLYNYSILRKASFLLVPAIYVQSYNIASTLILGKAPIIKQVQLPLLTVLKPFLYVYIKNMSEMFICLQVATKLMNGPWVFLRTLLPNRSSIIINQGLSGLPAVLIFSWASYTFNNRFKLTSLKQLFYSNVLYFLRHISTISYYAGSCLYVLDNISIRFGETFFYAISSFIKRVH